MAEQLATQPPAIDDPRLGNALTLHITALTDLLATATGQMPATAPGERELVRHERSYLRRAAAKRRLFDLGVLSDRVDDDERVAEGWAALERALAGVILLGPCDTSQAEAVGVLASEGRTGDVVDWLAAVYPPDGGFTVGTVQPDRLAELLLGPILTQQTDLLSQIGALTVDMDNALAVLFMLMRTADHSDFGQVGMQAADLITSRPDPFAAAAPILAATLAEPGRLEDGLIHLGQEDPQAFRRTAYTVLKLLPETSVSGALFSAALTQAMTSVLGSLAETNSESYLPDLAKNQFSLGWRLAEVGQWQAALAISREAVDRYRQLVETNPDAYLPGLVAALNSLGARLSQTGQRNAALAAIMEARDKCRELAAINPDANLPGLVMILNNLGIMLAETGQWQAALTETQEAIAIQRRLADSNPDEHLSHLAMSLTSLGVRLAQAGQRDAAVTAAQESADIYRQLAAADPDAHLPKYVASLTSLSNRLSQAGRQEAALAVARETANSYRRLVAINPDAYLPGLAGSLNNLGIVLAQAGQRQAAVAATQEAAATYRQLAGTELDAHLPGLAAALNNLSGQLGKVGQQQAAVSTAKEAADIYRQLAGTEPDAHLPGLAAALNILSDGLAGIGQIEAAVATGQEAVAIRRQLAGTDPDAHLRSLGTALVDLSNQLTRIGQQQAAVSTAKEAADIYRQLAGTEPDAHLPGLAAALNILSDGLAGIGQIEAAVATGQEAVAIRRQLAGTDPDAHLPDLARALNSLGILLNEAGPPQAALAVTQEAVTIRRQLVETNPDAHLRGLAGALNNLSNRLASIGQMEAAVATGQEAVDTFRRLAVANAEAYLHDLIMSLNNLSALLMKAERETAVSKLWESVGASLPEESSRLALLVAYARYLLVQGDAKAGVDLLVRILTTSRIPSSSEAEARSLLREQWRKHPHIVQQARQSDDAIPFPDWINLTDDHINIVIAWIKAETWHESRLYFSEHSAQLLADMTPSALYELALTAPEGPIDQHRALLDAVREYGLEGAYRPLLMAETFREWLAAPNMDASRTFLCEHPELLGENILGLLANSSEHLGPTTKIHQAILFLARTPADIDSAYQCLRDAQSLQIMVNAVIAAQDADQLHACAEIATLVHDAAFAGAVYRTLAWLLAGLAEHFPEDWARQLRLLAAGADTTEKKIVLSQLNTALVSLPADSAITSQLRDILSLPADA